MEHTKLVDNIQSVDTNELLKQLNNSSVSEVDKELVKTYEPVMGFLSHFNIKTGHYRVHKSLLYRLYSQWSKEPLRRMEFYTRLSWYFVDQRSNKTYLSLSKNKWNISNVLHKTLFVNSQKKLPSDHRRKQQFEKYLKYYDIKRGTSNSFIWIETVALYYLYDKWRFRFKGQTYIVRKFFRMYCESYFETQLKNKIHYSKIDASIKRHLTDEIRREIIQGYTRKWKRKPKIKIQQENQNVNT